MGLRIIFKGKNKNNFVHIGRVKNIGNVTDAFLVLIVLHGWAKVKNVKSHVLLGITTNI